MKLANGAGPSATLWNFHFQLSKHCAVSVNKRRAHLLYFRAPKMKLSLFFTSLLASRIGAFTVLQQPSSVHSNTALNLFGSGAKGGGGGGGENKGPGMMDQLAMFKKAQEMAQKKKKLDEELQAMPFEGVAADGKVKVSFKYVPNTNPMDPNPEYEPVSFDFDDAFFDSSSPEELSAAAKEAFDNGIENTNKAVAEKYAVLQTDLMEAFGQKPQQ